MIWIDQIKTSFKMGDGIQVMIVMSRGECGFEMFQRLHIFIFLPGFLFVFGQHSFGEEIFEIYGRIATINTPLSKRLINDTAHKFYGYLKIHHIVVGVVECTHQRFSSVG